MPVDKVSIEKFAQTIKDKYPQYKDIDDTLLTNSIIEKHPEYKDMVDFNAKPAFKSTVDFSNPASFLAPHAHEEYGAAIQGAATRMQAEAQNVDPAIKSLILDGMHQQRAATLQSQIQEKGDMANINPRLHQELQRILPKPLPEEVPQDEVNNMKQAAASDPNYFGMILQRHGEMNPDKMAQLKSDMYLLNSTPRAAGKESKILGNAEQMKAGKLDYDMAHPAGVEKPEGFFQSIVTAHQERNKELDDYEFFKTHSDADIIKKLNDERAAYDPDEPQPTPKGGKGLAGSIVGGNAEVMAKGGLAATLTTMGGAPEVAPFTAAAMTTPEMTARAFAGSVKNTYYQLLNQGVSPSEAIKTAKDQGTVDAVKSGLQNALMTVTGARLGLRPSTGYTFSPQFKSIITGIAKETGKFTKEALTTGVPNAVIAGGLELGSNYIAQKQGINRPIEQNVFQAAGGQLAMEIGLGATLKLGGKALKVVLNNVAKQPQGAVQASLKDMQNHGTITPVEAQTISDKIDATKALNDQIPTHIEDETTRIKIQDLIEHKTKLEGDLENLNKAYHPAIKNKIADIDEQIQKLSDLPVKEKAEGAAPTPKPTQGEKALVGMPEEISPRLELSTKIENNGNETNQTGLSKTEQAEKVDQPGAAPQEPAPVLEHAKKLIQKGIEKGTIPEEYKPFAEHADHFLDFINRQVEAGNEHHLRAEFGDELVDLAKQQPITNKTENNGTLSIEQSGTLGAHDGGTESIGGQSEGSGMGFSQQGTIASEQGNPQEVGQSAGEKNGNTIGISHESQTSRASKLGQPEPDRGEGVTIEETVQHGRDLLSKGGDPEKALADFNKDKKISYDDISVVRAHLEQLAKQTNEAVAKHGLGSPEADAAFKAEGDWRKQIKPMQTEWSKIGTAQQGETDIDTGTVMGLQRAYQEQNGKDFTPEQTAKAKELSGQVKALTDKVSDLEKQLSEAHNKDAGNTPEAKTIKAKAKQAADWIRKGKSAPPGSFSAATPASLVWDGAVETAAKVIEASGTVAQAIADGIDHIKNSDWYKGLATDKQQQAIHDFEEHVNAKNPDLAQRFANKKGNKFDPQDAKDIWDYAKEKYLDKGAKYTDMINNVSKDLGLSPEQVRNAITQPKGTRVISDEIYLQNAKRNDAIRKAKLWIKTNNDPVLIKIAKATPGFFFSEKVFGHGSVAPITHAGMNIFYPSGWKHYFPFMARSWKFSFGSLTEKGLATYNKAMEDLKNDPQFPFWKRNGLAVDPKEKTDDYQGAGKIFGKFGAIGDRGFNALKIFRLDMAKMFYNNLSDVEKADPETAKNIAKIVNHMSGTSEIDFGKISPLVNTVFFAPKLEMSRWQGLITDPAKAAITFTNWNKATPAEQVRAKIVSRKAGQIIATYMAGLAANSAILSLAGSKQSINYFHPTDNDWLKFKVGGKTVDPTGGMEASMRFMATLLHTGYLAYAGNKKDLREKPQEKDYKEIGKQARYKLSPFMSYVMDFSTGTDAMGRPTPGSKVPAKPGETRYTVPEYIKQQVLPIPIAEGIKGSIESMKENGMDHQQIKSVLTGILIGAVSGGTGAKVGTDYSLNRQTDEQKKTAAKLAKWTDELKITDKKLLPTDIQYDHSTPKPNEDQTAELNQMVKDSRQKLFESVQKDLDWEKMNDTEKKTALETVMKEGEETGKEAFKAKYPQFTPKRPEMTDEQRQKQQEQSEKERDIQRAIANKARQLNKGN